MTSMMMELFRTHACLRIGRADQEFTSCGPVDQGFAIKTQAKGFELHVASAVLLQKSQGNGFCRVIVELHGPGSDQST